MNTDEQIRDAVRTHYTRVAAGSEGCCGPSCGCSGETTASFADSYAGLEGHDTEADLALGCGLPTGLAGLRRGQRVLDLGSGAGIDAFVAAAAVGAEGHVIGVDMTPAMIARSRKIAERRGARNVEFRPGEIENLPVESGSVDVVISNCVLNLVPDKRRAFAEMARVLAPGGRFTVSDTVLTAPLPAAIMADLELYAGCVSGSLQREEYLRLLGDAGFVDVAVRASKPVPIPDTHADQLRGGPHPLFSITVTGWKSFPVPPAASVRPAVDEDLPLVRELLEAAALPTESIGTGSTRFFVAEGAGSILGCAGLERYGEDALFRSLAVRASLRGLGIGELLTRHVLSAASGGGARRAVLLTETAAPFFRRLGFAETDRASLGNEALAASSEFAGICPSGATTMVLSLAGSRGAAA